MHLFALIAVTMCAFAANSVLSRMGIFTYGMDPMLFGGLRLMSGAALLIVIGQWKVAPYKKTMSIAGGSIASFFVMFFMPLFMLWRPIKNRNQMEPHDRAQLTKAGLLVLYLVPFSLAYLTLPSGIGALILFGVVQITMFGASYLNGTRPTAFQWAGMMIALAGLGWLLWPSDQLALDVWGVIFMVVSGFGWGLFTMSGRGSRTPLWDMELSFSLSLPVALGMVLIGGGWSFVGVGTAIVCGAVTSGLGYALWYRVLPQIAATTGAVAQLSVPVIAILAGAVLLSEAITLDIVLASAVVLGGIAVSVTKR